MCMCAGHVQVLWVCPDPQPAPLRRLCYQGTPFPSERRQCHADLPGCLLSCRPHWGPHCHALHRGLSHGQVTFPDAFLLLSRLCTLICLSCFNTRFLSSGNPLSDAQDWMHLLTVACVVNFCISNIIPTLGFNSDTFAVSFHNCLLT